MNKRATTILMIVALFGLSTGYDFWRGYRHAHSFEDGAYFTFMGFVVLGIMAATKLLWRK